VGSTASALLTVDMLRCFCCCTIVKMLLLPDFGAEKKLLLLFFSEKKDELLARAVLENDCFFALPLKDCFAELLHFDAKSFGARLNIFCLFCLCFCLLSKFCNQKFFLKIQMQLKLTKCKKTAYDTC